MSWLILLFAGVLEVGWAAGLKLHGGNVVLIAATAVAAVASVVLLSIAMRQIPLSVAYAVWTGIGIVGTFAFGIANGEAITMSRLVSTALIIAGIAGHYLGPAIKL